MPTLLCQLFLSHRCLYDDNKKYGINIDKIMVQVMGPAGPGRRKTRESERETEKNKNKENDLAKRKVAATQAKLKQNSSKIQAKLKQNLSKIQAKPKQNSSKQSKTQRQGRSPSTKLRVRLRCNQSWLASPTGRAERWPAPRASSAARGNSYGLPRHKRPFSCEPVPSQTEHAGTIGPPVKLTC